MQTICRQSATLILLVGTLLVLGGCGGGGGGEMADGGGIGGTGITAGAVDAFGSIIVNDYTYPTDGTEVVVEGRSVGSGDAAVKGHLEEGMVVRIEGDFSDDADRTAVRIIYNDNVQGPVDEVIIDNDDLKVLIVMGQTIVVDRQANLENISFNGFDDDIVVEVSGLDFEWQGNIVVYATFVEKIADSLSPGDEVDLKGIVTELKPITQKFKINSLVIDYSPPVSLPGGVPKEGQLVEVKGQLAGGELSADVITPEDFLGADDADVLEIQGFITDFIGPDEFKIGNLTVLVDLVTVFENLDPKDLRSGLKLVIQGGLVDGVLLADIIREDG